MECKSADEKSIRNWAASLDGFLLGKSVQVGTKEVILEGACCIAVHSRPRYVIGICVGPVYTPLDKVTWIKEMTKQETKETRKLAIIS